MFDYYIEALNGESHLAYGVDDGYSELLRFAYSKGETLVVRDQASYELEFLTYQMEVSDVLGLAKRGFKDHADEFPRVSNLGISDVEAQAIIENKSWGWVYNELDQVAPATLARGFFTPELSDYSRFIGPGLQDLTREDLESRRAVLSLHEPYVNQYTKLKKLNGPGGPKPCTAEVQFRVREDVLYTHVHMRSQDLWLGLPNDLRCWALVSQYLADRHSIGSGILRFTVVSPHLYAHHASQALGFKEAKKRESGGEIRGVQFPEAYINEAKDPEARALEFSRRVGDSMDANTRLIPEGVKVFGNLERMILAANTGKRMLCDSCHEEPTCQNQESCTCNPMHHNIYCRYSEFNDPKYRRAGEAKPFA